MSTPNFGISGLDPHPAQPHFSTNFQFPPPPLPPLNLNAPLPSWNPPPFQPQPLNGQYSLLHLQGAPQNPAEYFGVSPLPTFSTLPASSSEKQPASTVSLDTVPMVEAAQQTADVVKKNIENLERQFDGRDPKDVVCPAAGEATSVLVKAASVGVKLRCHPCGKVLEPVTPAISDIARQQVEAACRDLFAAARALASGEKK